MTDRASNTFPVLAHGLVAGAIWLLTSLRSGRRQHKQWRWRPPTKDTFCKYRKCNYSRLFIPMSGNGGWELELATTPTAGTLMAPTDTAAKVERSLMLTLPLNFYCIAANWLIDSPFFPPCGARTAALNGFVSTWLWTHTRSEWLDGCRAAKQLSTVNTLAGLSTIQLLLSLFALTWQCMRHSVHFSFELCVNSAVVNISVKFVKLRIPAVISLLDLVTPQSLCANYAVNPALGPVWSRFSLVRGSGSVSKVSV